MNCPNSKQPNSPLLQDRGNIIIAVDSFVHSFCKLFGHIGTPEYGQGLTFQDYIANKLKKATLAQEQRTCTTYLTLTLNVRWEVGTL